MRASRYDASPFGGTYSMPSKDGVYRMKNCAKNIQFLEFWVSVSFQQNYEKFMGDRKIEKLDPVFIRIKI